MLLLISSAQAGVQTASITKLMGSVQVFTHPSKTLPTKKDNADGSTALFEGEYFQVRDAKVGDQVEEGNILRTKPSSRARVVYENGDQILVAPGTAYRIHWEPKTDTAAALDLMYGKIRGVVSKEGPRSKFTIRTKAATLGVRGTDFFVSENPSTGETQVSVIRGSVEVKPVVAAGKPPAAPIEVKMGYTVSTTSPTVTADASELAKAELKATSKEEFAVIEKISSVPAAEPTGAKTEIKTDKNIEKLEKKAIETTANDIKNYQPELYAKVSGSLSKMSSVEDLNAKSLSNLSVNAPSRPVKKRKPNLREMDTDEDQDPYRQYFKMEN